MTTIKTLTFSIVTLLFFNLSVNCQDLVPAPKQDGRVILTGGIAHIGDNSVILNSAICLENGKIIWVEDMQRVKIDPTNAELIDVSGKHVYPGLIALNTVLGLREIGAVRATLDDAETGGMNPNVRACISYNTDSKVTPTVRSNGILMAQIAPQGGRISGSSSVMQLDAWNWEDALIKEDDAIYMNWIPMYKYKGWWAEPGRTEINEKYEEQLESIQTFFLEAKAYAQQATVEKRNLKFDALKPIFNKQKKLFIRVNKSKEMMGVIDFAELLDIEVVIVGGKDSWMMADDLAKLNISVVLGNLHSLPSYHESDIDQVFKTPKILKDAGVNFCLSIDGYWQVRNLPFVAGNTVSYGLTKEEAIQSVTLSAAKILGLEKQCGSLEPGKDATLIVSTGDILDMRSSNIELAFIQGRAIDLGNKQKDLYNKYKSKYAE